MAPLSRPTAICLDLDDTILDDSLNIDDCWQVAYQSCRPAVADHGESAVMAAIFRIRDWYWSDRDRHRIGRLDLAAARREIVRRAFDELGVDDVELADGIGDAYTREREARVAALPGAIDTVRWLQAANFKLALVTNGAAKAQRAKIERFDLARLFDLVLVEGEMGYGKPDARVFERAIAGLGVVAADAWMVGDNLEWDVAAPQNLGMTAVWIDARRRGLPDRVEVRPTLVVSSLADLPEAAGWR